jgi:small conductance mechanosensitive channel
MVGIEALYEAIALWLPGPVGQGVVLLTRLMLLILMAKLVLSAGSSLVMKVLAREKPGFSLEDRKAKTLAPLLKSVLRYTVYFFVAISILDMLEIVSAATLAASAGILGLAVGFGAQGLVRDVLTGFFILFEDQFSVGEYVDAAGLSGVIEEIGLRVTKIRDFSGALHIVPNGAIDKVTNYDRGNMRALVKVAVAYGEDHGRVSAVLERAMEELKKEIPTITDGPQVLGMSELLDSGVEYLLWARGEPGTQWALAREMRKKAKLALDAAGIEVPYPHRVLINRGEKVV